MIWDPGSTSRIRNTGSYSNTHTVLYRYAVYSMQSRCLSQKNPGSTFAEIRDIQRMHKEYFDCPQRDSHAVHYI